MGVATGAVMVLANSYADILAQKNRQRNETDARRQLIEDYQTTAGGWTKEFIDHIGVQWPLRAGWKEQYIRSGKLPTLLPPLSAKFPKKI